MVLKTYLHCLRCLVGPVTDLATSGKANLFLLIDALGKILVPSWAPSAATRQRPARSLTAANLSVSIRTTPIIRVLQIPLSIAGFMSVVLVDLRSQSRGGPSFVSRGTRGVIA